MAGSTLGATPAPLIPPTCPDVAERLASLAALLADVALSVADARALVLEVVDNGHGRAIADALSVAGWLADFGARLAGDSGTEHDALGWFAKPETRIRLARLNAVQEGGAA